MISLADIFESLDPIVDGLFGLFLIAGFFFAAPKNFAIVTGMIIGGLILLVLLMLVLGSVFAYIHSSLLIVGVLSAYPVMGYILWKIKLILFSEKADPKNEK